MKKVFTSILALAAICTALSSCAPSVPTSESSVDTSMVVGNTPIDTVVTSDTASVDSLK